MSPLLQSFADALEALPLREAAGLGDARRAALTEALHAGLPTQRNEAWKYTSLRALERRRFETADATPLATDNAALHALLAAIPGPRLVFIDGRHAAAHSLLGDLHADIAVSALSELLLAVNSGRADARDANFLARRYDGQASVFAQINAALADDGAVIRAEAGAQLAAPLHLVHIATPAGASRARHLRHLIDLRNDAALDVVEHHLALDAGDADATQPGGFENHLCHVHLDQRARLRHARAQCADARAVMLLRTDAVLAREAEYRRLDLELGAALSRHELNVRLEGEGAQLHANGALLADGKRHVETRLGIDHIARDTASTLYWRGLGAGRGRAVFHGGIEIREGADGSDANLSNKNLLLGDQAEIDTQPVLVIHADEVKAAHGATVGQLDPTALFYLRSRGLPQAEARRMLTAAFCRETLAVLDDSALAALLQPQLDAALARLSEDPA